MSTSNPTNLGVPDVATLAQLANQFFTALPAAAPVATGFGTSLPPGLSHLSSSQAPHPFAVSNVIGSQPSLTPDVGISPTVVPNVPMPGAVPTSATPVPSSFHGDVPLGHNPVGNTHGLQPALTLNPLDWGLPSDAELADLLALPSPSTNGNTAHALAAPSPSFYFLEHAQFGQPGLNTPGLVHPEIAAKPQGFKPPFDVNLVRRDFPILGERVNGRPLIWLDNTAALSGAVPINRKPGTSLSSLVAYSSSWCS